MFNTSELMVPILTIYLGTQHWVEGCFWWLGEEASHDKGVNETSQRNC